MKVIVTGGAGFVGSAVCRRLAAAPQYAVLNVDRLGCSGNLASVASIAGSKSYQFVRADVLQPFAMTRIVESFEPDAVIHLAAETNPVRSVAGASGFVQANIVGTSILLDAVLKYWSRLPADRQRRFRFIHVSTTKGSGSDYRVLESGRSLAQGYSPYAASKAAAEHLVRSWHSTYGLPTVISRSPSNYGPWQNPERFLPFYITRAIDADPLGLAGDAAAERDWIFVEDHVDALTSMLERGSPGCVYHLAGSFALSDLAALQSICDALDKIRPTGRPHRRLIQDPTPSPDAACAPIALDRDVKTGVEWPCATPFETGIEQTVRWYVENQAWWRPAGARTQGAVRSGVLERESR